MLNIGGYGALRAFSQYTKTRNAPGLDVTGLDFVTLAQAQGCAGYLVKSAADLEPALREAFSCRRTTLVEVAVRKDFEELFRTG